MWKFIKDSQQIGAKLILAVVLLSYKTGLATDYLAGLGHLERALFEAVDSCNFAAAQAALDGGANLEAVDSLGNTPLLEAIGNTNAGIASRARRCAKVAGLLIKRGANINAANNLGNTPLSVIAMLLPTVAMGFPGEREQIAALYGLLSNAMLDPDSVELDQFDTITP